MKRKVTSNSNYVRVEPEEKSNEEMSKSKQWTITLSEKQWLLIDILTENKLIPSLEQHLNEAIQSYVEQMASCLTGGVQSRSRSNQPTNRIPKATSFTDDYSDGEFV